MAFPKLEGRITIPTGGYTFVVAEPVASATTITIAAGDYYLTHSTSLLSSIASAMTANAVLSGTYTVSITDSTDAGTGAVTISATAGVTAFRIQWPSANGLYDVLGFTSADTTSAAQATGTKQANFLWLPNVGRSQPLAAEPTTADQKFGQEEADFTIAVAPSGYSKRFAYNRRFVDTLNFFNVVGEKTWLTLEATTNQSFQKFYRDVVFNGYPFRYQKDRSDADTIYWELVVEDAQAFKPTPVVPGWTGAKSLWNITYIVRESL